MLRRTSRIDVKGLPGDLLVGADLPDGVLVRLGDLWEVILVPAEVAVAVVVLLGRVVVGRVRRGIVAADLEVRRGGRGGDGGEDGGGREGREGELEASCLGEHVWSSDGWANRMGEMLGDVKL